MATASPDLTKLFKSFGRIGLLSFGGPAAQIALMHRVLVDEEKWLSEKQYLNALSFCMLLPGPEAMQLATYVGWRLKGIIGGLLTGLLFVLPGAFVIFALACIYAYFGNVPLVNSIFLGVKAAVVVIVIEALIKVAKRALKQFDHWVIAALAYVAIFFLALPFPIIIALAAIYGAITAKEEEKKAAIAIAQPFSKTLTIVVTWAAIWIVPLLLVAALDPGEIMGDIGFFFSKLAVVTFGGAYAVLAYMAQDVVNHFGWLTAGQMMDGLGLAETTPGPLILVTEFVGFLAGFQAYGIWGAILATIVTLWATFVPCFLWVFAGAPYIEWIGEQPRLKGALSAITAAVVGVILNLSIWFALHVFFKEVTLVHSGIFHIWQPTFSSIDWRPFLLAGVSAVLLFGVKWGVAKMLTIAATLGLLLQFIT